jgi:hypothetical protein
MGTRALVIASALAVLVAGVSVAAAQPPTKGKPPTTGPGCKPQVMVVLKGTLVTAPGASGTSMTLTVTQANKHGQAYVKATQPVSVVVGTKTVVRREGKKTLGDLVSGDRVLVQARACLADLANGATPTLTAVRVVAHPAR